MSLSFSMKFSIIQRRDELSLFIFLSCSSFQFNLFIRFSFFLIRLSLSRSKSVSRNEGRRSSEVYPFLGACIKFWMYASYLAILFSRCSRYIFTSCSSFMWLRIVASNFCVCISSEEQLWMLTKFSEMIWMKYCTKWQVSRGCVAVTVGFSYSLASSVKSYSAGNIVSSALRMVSWVCLLVSSPLCLGDASRVWNYSIIINWVQNSMRKHTKQGIIAHQRSILRLLLQLLVEFALLEERLLLSLDSLKLLKYVRGQNSRTARSEFQYSSICGILPTRSLMACSFFSEPIYLGQIFSRRLTASYTTKSMMLISARNHGSSLHSFSQMSRMGLILFYQQYSIHFLFSSSQVGREAHFAPIIARQRSVLLRMLSTRAFYSIVLPNNYDRFAFSMMQVTIATGPVVKKSPS